MCIGLTKLFSIKLFFLIKGDAMYCTCCIEVFDSIDQTVTQDVKELQRNHKHVLFPAMQFPPQQQCCPIRGKLTTSMHI